MYRIFISCLFAVSGWCRLAEEQPVAQLSSCLTANHCFHQPVEACPQPETKCRCQQLPNCKKAAICCDLNNFQLTEGLACANISTNGDIEALHIRNATLDVLNVTQPAWKRLKYMTITDGHISSVVGEFGRHSIVSCLNLSSNRISKFENRSLVNLYNLGLLDLSNNDLTDVPRFKKKGHVTLDISNNEPMLCTHLYDAIKRTELDFINHNNTSCWSSTNFQWFNSTVKMALSQVEVLHELNQQCSDSCTCMPYRNDFAPGKPSEVFVSVKMNCSGKQLMSLPMPLPPNTVSLNISNNNISSLDIINSDPTYHNLRELYADNNQITSILPLEGSKFINNFVALSLRNNKLKALPTYFLSNIFDRNTIIRQVNLGLNKIQCDCHTAKVLKVWLITKQKNIPDYEELYCDNLKVKVLDLDSTKLCQSQQDWTDYIYYLITAEVLLLVSLVAKVSYDYWVFKTAGYLPWPASKMPKLPCDWLCE